VFEALTPLPDASVNGLGIAGAFFHSRGQVYATTILRLGNICPFGPLPLYSLPQGAVMCGMILVALLAGYCIAQLPSALSTLVVALLIVRSSFQSGDRKLAGGRPATPARVPHRPYRLRGPRARNDPLRNLYGHGRPDAIQPRNHNRGHLLY